MAAVQESPAIDSKLSSDEARQGVFSSVRDTADIPTRVTLSEGAWHKDTEAEAFYRTWLSLNKALRATELLTFEETQR